VVGHAPAVAGFVVGQVAGVERDVGKIEVCKARWKLRFYCWCWLVFLIPATAQGVDIVLALVEHRPPRIVVERPMALR
jgi:hypothetical protein